MVDVAQQVRASDCGSEGRGFESHLPPEKNLPARSFITAGFFVFSFYNYHLPFYLQTQYFPEKNSVINLEIFLLTHCIFTLLNIIMSQ